jgi:serine/threonine protein phosphatase PrpC
VQLETAKVSLTGHRAENQDRVDVVSQGPSVLMIVVDGMGGHAEGAKASEAIVSHLSRSFREAGQPVLDPQGFLIAALSAAHDKVVSLGAGIPVEQRPRATCAVCLVQDDNLYCAHIGDSRIYQLRGKSVLHRSRDHSHVELLLHEGLIEEDEIRNHPMRNFVECCLGGDEPLPDMSIAPRRQLANGDVVVLCSDGLWSGTTDAALTSLVDPATALDQALQAVARDAVERNAPNSDNTTAAALRINGQAP